MVALERLCLDLGDLPAEVATVVMMVLEVVVVVMVLPSSSGGEEGKLDIKLRDKIMISCVESIVYAMQKY